MSVNWSSAIMGCNQSSDGQWAYPVNGHGMSNGAIDVSSEFENFLSNAVIHEHCSYYTCENKFNQVTSSEQ